MSERNPLISVDHVSADEGMGPNLSWAVDRGTRVCRLGQDSCASFKMALKWINCSSNILAWSSLLRLTQSFLFLDLVVIYGGGSCIQKMRIPKLRMRRQKQLD